MPSKTVSLTERSVMPSRKRHSSKLFRQDETKSSTNSWPPVAKNSFRHNETRSFLLKDEPLNTSARPNKNSKNPALWVSLLLISKSYILPLLWLFATNEDQVLFFENTSFRSKAFDWLSLSNFQNEKFLLVSRRESMNNMCKKVLQNSALWILSIFSIHMSCFHILNLRTEEI